MSIVKRSNVAQAIAAQPKQKEPDTVLNIVAKPKRPMQIEGVLDDFTEPSAIRAVGSIAIACGDLPDAGLNVRDKVRLIRTPYDQNNPQELRYRARVKNRGTAITAMCIVCQGTRKAVTECIDTQCPLWPFRFGGDPFYGKRK